MRQPLHCWILLFGVFAELTLIFIYFKHNRAHVTPHQHNVANDANTDAKSAFQKCRTRKKWWSLFNSGRGTETPSAWRNFNLEPVRIGGTDMLRGTPIDGCPVGCVHYPVESRLNDDERGIYFDASFVDMPTHGRDFLGMTILRTMESSVNQPSTILREARKNYDIVMTTRLDSDVPVPYFSWELYDFMQKPPKKRSVNTLSSAVFSNCDAQSIRQEAVDMLVDYSNSLNLTNLTLVETFGLCSNEQTRVKVDKIELISRYKFHLAFENSNDIDYVTEKFFQALQAGTVPVVIGAPNIHQYAPSNNSILVIETLDDVAKVAETMVALHGNGAAYDTMLLWKRVGPSTQFKALVDLANVHSSCRVCIHVADRLRRREMMKNSERCQCQMTSSSSVFKFYVRERGRFEFFEAFLFSWETSYLKGFLEATLKAFQTNSLETYGYWPSWAWVRDGKGRRPKPGQFPPHRPPPLRLYRVYEAASTQGQVLYGTAAIDSDEKVRQLFSSHNCLYFEVIFV